MAQKKLEKGSLKGDQGVKFGGFEDVIEVLKVAAGITSPESYSLRMTVSAGTNFTP